MDAQRLRHHDGLQKVALKLVDEHDNAENDERNDPTVRDECYNGGQDAGNGCSDKGNERAQEDNHGEGQREGHLQDQETNADTEGIDGSDGGRTAHVATQGTNRGVTDAVPAIETLTAKRPQEELPNPVAIFEEEEEDHDTENDARDNLSGRRHPLNCTEPKGRARREIDDCVPRFIESILIDRERSIKRKTLQLLEALHGRVR